MSSPAERQRRYRQRLARGLAVFGPLELPEFEVLDWLIDAGRLTDEESADPAAVARALERAILDTMKKRYAVTPGRR